MKYGTTKKQSSEAIASLCAAGFKAWLTPSGHHYLIVMVDKESRTMSVPRGAAFVALRAA